MAPVYKRILLKLSGEVLAGESGKGIDFDTVKPICEVIKECADMGVQIGIVVGGGNFWRGRSSGTMDRSRADQMGMLATVMNSLALQEALIQEGVDAVVMTALDIQRVGRSFNKDEAVKLLEEGRGVIFISHRLSSARMASARIPARRCEPARLKRTSSSRPATWTACMTRTPTNSPTR